LKIDGLSFLFKDKLELLNKKLDYLTKKGTYFSRFPIGSKVFFFVFQSSICLRIIAFDENNTGKQKICVCSFLQQ